MIEYDLQIAPTVERWSEASAYRAFVGQPRIAKIIVLKVDHIGDFILGFDALAALRDAFPNARIDLVCGPWNKELASSLGLFDHIHTIAFFDKRADGEHPYFRPEMTADFQGEHYDLAIDLRVDPDTRVILRHIIATYKAGFDSSDHRDIMTMYLPHYLPQSGTNIGMHQTMLMLRLIRSVDDLFNHKDAALSLLLGRVAQPAPIDLSMARDRVLVMCNTSSGREVKNWPSERFRRLIRWLAVELDVVVLLLGGPDQMADATETIQFCGSPNVISAVGKTSMREAIGLVPQASLFIGNDSALTHVAARVGVPTVALFSGIDPTEMWASLGANATILRAPVPCSPCHILHFSDCRSEHACMRNITEVAVRAAVYRHLFAARRYGQVQVPSERPVSVRKQPMYLGWASSHSDQTPQRYGDNHDRYLAQGGRLDLTQMLHAFTAENRNNRGDLNRFYMFALIFDQIIKEQIPGDIAELGVYKGNTAVLLGNLARQIGVIAYLFDTFEGFADADLKGVDSNKRTEFSDTSLAAVQALVGFTNVSYVKGYFPETASEVPADARFCLVHIDCDLYAPFKAALEFFYHRLEPGGFLIMHDYASLHWDGAERAVDEFFSDKPECVVGIPDGSGTAVVRKLRPAGQLMNWYTQSRTSGFAHVWIRAGDAEAFLISGWAQPEPWGVWGLGSSHTLNLLLSYQPGGDIELEVESTVPLMSSCDRQSISVLVEGNTLAVWTYEQACNTAVRTVHVPAGSIGLQNGVPAVRVEFRPTSAVIPNAFDPANPDDRELGLGLIRFRQRPMPLIDIPELGTSSDLPTASLWTTQPPTFGNTQAEAKATNV